MATAEIEYGDDELIEVRDVSSSLEALNRSEIDIQITTAKRYPRSIKAFKQQAMEMATLDEETAGSMFYVLPRGGKKIEGPSVRLAEVVGSCYGNLRYGSRIVAVDEKFITAQGACHDLEKNIAINYEVKRRITNKAGVRFNDDMIQTTGNAACAIALREAIFKIVPRSIFKAIYEEARLTSVGKATSMSEKRHKAVDWFKKAGATEAQIFGFLGRAGIDEITIDDLITLRGMVTAIKDGEITIEAAFAVEGETPATGSKAKPSKANDLLKPKQETKPAEEPKPEATTEPAAMSDDEKTLAGFEQLLETIDGKLKCDSMRDQEKKKHPHLAAPIDELTERRIAAIAGSRGANSNK